MCLPIHTAGHMEELQDKHLAGCRQQCTAWVWKLQASGYTLRKKVIWLLSTEEIVHLNGTFLVKYKFNNK